MDALLRARLRTLLVATAAAAGLLLAGSGSGMAATSASWATPFFSFGNTNYNPGETVLGTSTVASLAQRSAYLLPAGALQLSNILSVGTTQYVEYSTQDQAGSFSEHVTAINLAKRKTRWTTTSAVAPGSAVPFTGQPGPIADVKGVIYASAYDHLDAVNATTGAILWTYTPAQQTADLHLQAVAGGRVFIRDGYANQTIEALNASTGGLEWAFPTGEPIQDAAYANGMLYIGSGDHEVYAVNATTGVQKWTHTDGLGSPFVAAAQSVVYTYALQDVDALNPKNGHVIWTHTLPAGYSAPPVVGGGSAFFTDGYEMSALSTTNGALQWSNFGATPGNCAAVGANGVVYCAAQSGDVVAYAAADGRSLWSTTLAGGVTAGPIVVNGCLYLGTTQSGRDELVSYCG